MKKINLIQFSVIIFFFVATSFFNTKNVLASNCTQIGDTTFCDDGTRYDQIGNTTFGSDGTKYDRIGNTTFGNDGTKYDQIGNTIFGNDGTKYDIIGNNIFGNDGSSYQKIGNTTFGSGGANVYFSCPQNSSYDSLSGKCKCDYGYEISGSDCVYETITFPDFQDIPSTQRPTKSKCPANSHLSATDTTKCQCDYGFQINTTGDTCIPNIITTINNTNNSANNTSGNQTCREKHGANAYLGTDGECQCKDGYPDIFDDQCITYDEACKWYEKGGKIMHGVANADGTYTCYSCNDGFYWDETKKECLKNNNNEISAIQDTTNELEAEVKKQKNSEIFKPTKKETINLKNNPTSHLSDSDNDNEVDPANNNDETKTGIEVKNTETTTTSIKIRNRIFSFFSSLFKKIKFW